MSFPILFHKISYLLLPLRYRGENRGMFLIRFFFIGLTILAGTVTKILFLDLYSKKNAFSKSKKQYYLFLYKLLQLEFQTHVSLS